MAGLKLISNKSVKLLSAGEVEQAVQGAAKAAEGLVSHGCLSCDFSWKCEQSFNISEKY